MLETVSRRSEYTLMFALPSLSGRLLLKERDKREGERKRERERDMLRCFRAQHRVLMAIGISE